MITKTSKAVLTPLADAVTALIVIISDSEIAGTPTPDLSQLSKVVDAQIKNLTVVANKITMQPNADPALKITMQIAFLDASTMLVTASNELLKDPVSPKGRQTLLEGVRGILKGTTTILDVFDESEIRKVLQATALSRHLLLTIDGLDKREEVQAQYLHVCKRFAQALFAAVQLSHKRVKDILSDRLASDLSDAIDCISKESNIYMNGCKIVISNPESVDALQLQQISKRRIDMELLRIDAIISCKDADDFYSQARVSVTSTDKYTKARNLLLSAPISEQWEKSHPEAKSRITNFVDAANSKAAENQDIYSIITDSDILAFPASVSRQSKSFCTALHDILSDSQLPLVPRKADHDSKELISAVDSCVVALDANLSKGVIMELLNLLGDMTDVSNINTTVGQMKSNVESGNLVEINGVTKQFDIRSKKVEKLVNHILREMSPSHPSYALISTWQNRATNGSPAVICGSDVYQKITNEITASNLNEALSTYTEATNALQNHLLSYEGVFTANELLDSARCAFMAHSKNLGGFMEKRNVMASGQQLNAARNTANQLVRMIEKEKENTEDSVYKAALESELVYLRSAVPQFFTYSGSMLNHVDSYTPVEVQEFHRIIAALGVSFSNVNTAVYAYKGEAARGEFIAPKLNLLVIEPEPVPVKEAAAEWIIVTPVEDLNISKDSAPDDDKLSEAEQTRLLEEAAKTQDDQLRNLTSAIKELVIVHQEAPKLLSEDEAQQDPIKAAGQELKVEASHWASESNGIVVCVDRIGQKFLDLSAFHKELAYQMDPRAKRSFIQTALEIMQETARLVIAVDPLIKACADKRLVMQIQQTMARLSTLSQTLKVIAAVKASAPRDSDKAVQLISNGQNLVQSVKMVLRDAISCSLRLKKGSPADLVRFRKVVYASKIKK